VLANDLCCPVGTRWFCVSSLRYGRVTGDLPGGVPLGLTDVYVDPAHAEVGNLARRSPDRLISSFVAERTGQRIARIKQDVTAVLIGRRLSSLLIVHAGSPGLRIIRRYLDDNGESFVGSVSVHPPAGFTSPPAWSASGRAERRAGDQARV
jgi:GntR family transcriptional regulator